MNFVSITIRRNLHLFVISSHKSSNIKDFHFDKRKKTLGIAIVLLPSSNVKITNNKQKNSLRQEPSRFHLLNCQLWCLGWLQRQNK